MAEAVRHIDERNEETTAAPLPPNMLAPVYKEICFRLPNPLDRRHLRSTTRQVSPIVDDSWRDLQMLEISMAPGPPTDPLMVSKEMAKVKGETKDPDTGDQRDFTQAVPSVELLDFLKWVGPRLPSVVLRMPFGDEDYLKSEAESDESEIDEYPPTSAADTHPIIDVLSACADATVMPSVVDVTVMSRLLLWDPSLLDALIQWADCRRRAAADHDDVAFWRSLTLRVFLIMDSGRCWSEEIRRLKNKFGEPPADIERLLKDGCGDLMLHTNDPLQPDTPSNRWRKALKGLLTEKLRRLGMSDPEGDFKLVVSLLQKLVGRCESLQSLDVDEILQVLQLRPTALKYPRTLTKLKCDRFGKVAGELKAIVDNCPMLEEIELSLSLIGSIDHGDMVALTKLERLRNLALDYVPLEALTDHLLQMEPTSSPWPNMEMIDVQTGGIPHLLIGALINCCPKLSMFEMVLYPTKWTDEEVVAREAMYNQLCRLPRLTKLNCCLIHCYPASPPDDPFLDRRIEDLITYSPHLQEITVGLHEMSRMSLRRLLNGCHELRSVSLLDYYIDLRSPDVVTMLLGIAADVGDRSRRVQIWMEEGFGHVSQESLDEVVVGLPPGVRLWHSSFADRCLHDRRRLCWQCCLDRDWPIATKSLVIAHSSNLQSIVVFTY